MREAVGPDIALMLDGYHWYSRSDALTIGKALEKLNFAWFEEPMEEESMASYAWPISGPTASRTAAQALISIAGLGAKETGGIQVCSLIA